MFVSDTHLPHLLRPEFYRSDGQHRTELERLFLPSWHCVGAMGDLARDGDYLTTELLERPLIVWRNAAKPQAYLNVCPHRFSIVRREACGNAERLTCQYHGWEFDETGLTRRIPDAPSFRPLEQGALRLVKFRTEMCGQLIFVTLDDDAPSLSEFLGPGFAMGERLVDAARRHVVTTTVTTECNWKVAIENYLESYHIDMVHPKTFKHFPDAELCTHTMGPRWTMFEERAMQRKDHFLASMGRIMLRQVGMDVDTQYRHMHCYPNHTFIEMGMFSVVQFVLPVSPTTCLNVTKVFCYSGKPGTIRARVMFALLKAWGKRFFPKVVAEDTAIQPWHQRGISAAAQPRGGLISAREERIFHFQNYILRETSIAK